MLKELDQKIKQAEIVQIRWGYLITSFVLKGYLEKYSNPSLAQNLKLFLIPFDWLCNESLTTVNLFKKK